jgi:hypothetical protein
MLTKSAKCRKVIANVAYSLGFFPTRGPLPPTEFTWWWVPQHDPDLSTGPPIVVVAFRHIHCTTFAPNYLPLSSPGI